MAMPKKLIAAHKFSRPFTIPRRFYVNMCVYPDILYFMFVNTCDVCIRIVYRFERVRAKVYL